MAVRWSNSGITTRELICDRERPGTRQGDPATSGGGRVRITRSAIWYVLVIVAWVAVIDSGWLVLWGPGTSWHRWYFFVAWSALSVRRVLCDLNTFARRTWWCGWAANMRDLYAQDEQQRD